jgi:large subunit ribosomal protein L19
MDLIAQLEAEQIAALGKDIPDFKPGDTVRVGYKVTEGTRSRVQNYEGVCISRKHGQGIAASFTVRKISFGEGVERVFPLYSTNIAEITVILSFSAVTFTPAAAAASSSSLIASSACASPADPGSGW